MSKIKVKVTNPSNGQYRLVELEARAPSLVRVDGEARRKFGVSSSLQFLFKLPSGTHIAVNSDADLQRACQESIQQKKPYVDLELSGPGAYQAAQQSQASHQAHQQPAYHQPAQHQPAHQQPAYHQPAHQQPAQQARPAPAQSSFAAGPNALANIHIRGAPGGADRMKVVAKQEDDCYVFSPESAPAQDTLIEVELPTSRQLIFRITSAASKLTQTFNMPFDVNPKNLSAKGETVVLMFDW